MYKGILFLIRLEIHGCLVQQFVAYGNMSGHTKAIFEFQPLPPDMTLEKVIFVRDGVNTERTIIQPPMVSSSSSSSSSWSWSWSCPGISKWDNFLML